MNFIKIAWRDISSIFRNKFLRISVTAIIIVPLLYSLLYLAAFWDPYSKLHSMPVAVVNMDKGSVVDNKTENYGKDIVDKLKDNDKIGWKFVSLDEAKKGLEGKDYYAMFVIPESFSKDVLSAKDGKPKQPGILYSANEKKNFLAAQINGKVLVELKAEITKSISENYTKVAFDNLYEIKDGMNKAADGSKELYDGMEKLNENVPKMAEGVEKLYDGSTALKDGVGQLRDKVNGGASTLSKYYPQLVNLLSKENINSIKGVMASAGTLVNADTSMLSIVPELMTPDNMALAQKTAKDLKSANIQAVLNDPMIGKMKGLVTPNNMNNINKLAKDADELSKFDFNRFQGLGVIAKNPNGLLTMAEDANRLYGKVDQSRLLPIMNLAQNSDKVFGVVNDVNKLQGSLDKAKLQPILYLAQNDEARKNLLGLLEKSNGVVGSIDMQKLQPLIALSQNQNVMKGLVEGKAALDNFDVDKSQGLLKAQEDKSKEFIGASIKLNEAVVAINNNPNLTADQKNAALANVALKYQALVNGTATNMAQSAAALGEMKNNLTTLGNVKASLNSLPPMDKLQESIGYANTQLPKITELLQAYSANKAQINGVLDGVKYLNSALPQINGIYTNYETNVKPLLKGVPESALYAKSLLPEVQKLQGDIANNKEVIGAIKGTLTPENIAYLKEFATKLPQVKADLDSNAGNIQAAKLLLQKVNEPSTKATIAQLDVLASDVENAKPVMAKLESQLTPENMEKLSQTPVLVQELTSMQKQLQNNYKILEVAKDSLNDGNIQMAQGLISAIPQLKDGVNKLADGSEAINNGLGELNSKIPELQDGSQKLTDGSKELNEKLTEGANKLNSNLVNDSDTMGKFVSEPVIMDENPINPVKDYGTGFAPYFIPLSLWVGALMMFFVITEKVDGDIEAKPGALVLGKFLSYGYIGILQSVFASVVVLALGLKPANIPLYILFNVFMSFVFIAIIQSLIFLLGEAGRLLAIVLLILQLTSCAGTFPLEVVPSFFKVLNPFMPFTYCVSALRETISGVDYAVFGKDVAVLAGILIGFLIVSVLMKGHADKLQKKLQERKESVVA